MELPTQFTQAANGGEFMFYKDKVDTEKTQPLVMFIRQWSEDILNLKTHGVWLFDGTYCSSTIHPGREVILNIIIIEFTITWLQSLVP